MSTKYNEYEDKKRAKVFVYLSEKQKRRLEEVARSNNKSISATITGLVQDELDKNPVLELDFGDMEDEQ